MRALLILVAGALCMAQPSGAPKPIFPDDTQDPKQAGGAELLEAVCPGHVAVDKQFRCDIVCQSGTSFANEDLPWDLARISQGHYLSPESDDAALWMLGCESHASGFGGRFS